MAKAPPDTALRALTDTAAPHCEDPDTLDVRALGPPEPLTRTLEHLAELPSDGVLVQLNDRAPQHLYPRIEDRGFDYETVEYDDTTVTVIWHAN